MPTEIVPELFRVPSGPGQFYVWADDDAITLIDCGMPGTIESIEAALRDLDASWSSVRRLVLTHFHADHAGNAAAIASRSEAEVVAHTGDVPFIRGDAEGPEPVLLPWERELHASVAADVPQAPPSVVHRTVTDGDILDFGGGAEVIATPGHTPGSIGVLLPARGVLFTGDTIAHGRDDVILGVFNVDRPQTVASFRRLADLEGVETACFGHGPPIVANAHARLRRAAVRLDAT